MNHIKIPFFFSFSEKRNLGVVPFSLSYLYHSKLTLSAQSMKMGVVKNSIWIKELTINQSTQFLLLLLHFIRLWTIKTEIQEMGHWYYRKTGAIQGEHGWVLGRVREKRLFVIDLLKSTALYLPLSYLSSQLCNFSGHFVANQISTTFLFIFFFSLFNFFLLHHLPFFRHAFNKIFFY